MARRATREGTIRRLRQLLVTIRNLETELVTVGEDVTPADLSVYEALLERVES